MHWYKSWNIQAKKINVIMPYILTKLTLVIALPSRLSKHIKCFAHRFMFMDPTLTQYWCPSEFLEPKEHFQIINN